MGQVVEQGVTSFKMFMAYPGVLFVDDGQIFRGMQRAGEIGALVCMHAENGIPIDILVQQALAKGHTAPIYHGLTRPQIAEAEGTFRAICLAEMASAPVYMVHLSAERALAQVVEARDRGLPVFAETCPQYLFLSQDDLAPPGLRGRQVRLHAAAPAQGDAGGSLARPAHARSPGGLDRPLPVLHEGAEGARAGTASPRSRTGCPASRRGSTCSGTAACAPAGSP